MNYLTYPLDHGYITRYLVSEVRKEEVNGEKVALSGDSNVWIGSVGASSHENPVRKAFLKTVKPECPEILSFEPEGYVSLLGTKLKLNYRAPFSDPLIGNSAFYSTPLWISLASLTILKSPDERCVKVLCSVKGAMELYLNGEKAISFRPYKRNELIEEVFSLNLKEGDNLISIMLDEFAERDTECNASLRIIENASGLQQSLPMGERNTDAIKKVERAIECLAFEKNNFTSGHVYMRTENPYKEKDFIVRLKGATEENTFLNILCEKEATFEKGENRADLGPVETFPVGFLRFNVKTEVENLSIETIRTFENFPLSFLHSPAKTVKERKMQAFKYLAKYGEQNANRAIALLYTDGDKDEIETILRRQLDFINRRSDCSDFYISYFSHIIRNFSDSHLLRKETLEDMKECLLNFRYWCDESGNDAMWFWSENHALMFHTSELIAGELYPDEIFRNSGMTGREHQKKAKDMLMPWFETFFKTGFTEWNSPPYLPIDSLGFFTLYAMAEDEEIKENAERALDYMFRLLAITSFDGTFSTTSGRTYLKELFGNHSNCPSFINWIAYGIGNESHAGKGSVPFCISDYEPDKENLKYHKINKGDSLWHKSTHGYNGYADITIYKTDTFLLSAANNFCPGRRGFQEDVVHAVFSQDEHIFINHPGEFALFGHARPSYWAGSGTLPRVNQYKGYASVIYKIDEKHPVDFTHLYFPIAEFKESEIEEHYAFALSHSGAYIAIYSHAPMRLVKEGANYDRELIALGRENAYFIRIANAYEFESFQKFKERIKNMKTESTTLSVKVNDFEYGLLSSSFDTSLTVNGKEEIYSGFGPEGKIII